jgi:hypothetical protein
MTAKGRKQIEIEKTQQAPLASLDQAVIVYYSNFLGTALI